jgi:MFS family permease
MGILAGFKPQVSNLRFVDPENLPKLEFILDSTQVKVRNQPVTIPDRYKEDFELAVKSNSRFVGSVTSTSVLLMDLDIPISELFGKLIANDFIFEKFYLTNSKGTIIFPEESVGNLLFEPKPLSQDTTGIHSGITFSTIILDGNKFKAYANPIYLGPNRLYFVGLYDINYFQTVGLRINFNLLSTLLFTLILLIASVPILAVVKMGRGDKMTQSRIIHVGLSLMTMAVMMGFMLSFSKNRPNPEKILERQIQGAADNLKSNLNQFESLSKFWYDPFGINIPNATNELIQIDYPSGFVKKMSFHLKNGMGTQYIQFENNPSFIYLQDREYFKYYKQKEKKSTFLDSHYSRGTGDLESVIAYQDTTSESLDVNAVTFSIKIDSTLNQNHRILLIKEDGKVLFKSKKVESLVSNLSESISPNKWKEVSSLIKNNRELPESTFLHVPLYLNGHQYDAIFRRIETSNYDQILWQVFLVNTNLFHAFSALTTLEGIIFLSFYFFFFLFTLFAQWSTRTGSSNKGFKSFLFEWLVPNEKNRPRLNYLMLGYLVIFMVLSGILGSQKLNPISTLALLIFTSLNISLVNLATAQVAEMRATRRVSSELIVLTAIYLTVFLVVMLVFSSLILGMIILLVFSILIVVGWALLQPKRTKWKFLNLIKSAKSTLCAYLVLWFFLIGFLPGYLIQSKTQQFESVIWNQADPSLGDIDPKVEAYELTRRNMMVAISDPFDPKIQNFIAADQHLIQKAWEGTTTSFSTNPIWYFAFAFLVVITFFNYQMDPKQHLFQSKTKR